MMRIGTNVKLCNLSNYFKNISIRTISNVPVIDGKSSNTINTSINSIRASLLQSNIIHQPMFEKYRKIFDIPISTNLRIENPKNIFINEIFEIPKYVNIIETPSNSPVHNKIEAARLIVIRKRKMKKHKLKKLRKKMKFEWAKVRQRREMRKEKAFQAELILQIKEAEKFSAENYVNQKLKEANETPIPRYWKGRRLPQFIIKEKLGLK